MMPLVDVLQNRRGQHICSCIIPLCDGPLTVCINTNAHLSAACMQLQLPDKMVCYSCVADALRRATR